MVLVECFHHPLRMENSVSKVKVGIIKKEKYSDLRNEFLKAKLVLSALPVTVERSERLELPPPKVHYTHEQEKVEN